MIGVHPAANEAAVRHLAKKLHDAELDLAIAVGNIAWKDAVIQGLNERIAELEAAIEEAVGVEADREPEATS